MSVESPDDVAIVGGGHAGLLAGAVLARLGLAVRVVERQPAEAVRGAPADGRSLALVAGSLRTLRRFGLWPGLELLGEPVWRTEVADAVTGRRVAYDAPAGDGPFACGFENAVLRRGLLAAFLAVAGPDRLVRGEVAALDRQADRARLTLADGRAVEARLLVAADGRRSRVRELARIGVRVWRYPQAAVALVLGHTRPHAQVAREWLRPEGPLALLPLPGGRTGVTWVEPGAVAKAIVAEGEEALLARLGRETGGVLGRLALVSGPALYPLGALHAERYVAPRLALVGDAAHGVHPIHAQGFNMGVADVAALADALVAARARGIDPGSGDALVPYARARWRANEGRLLLTDTLNRVFSTASPPLAQARGLALTALDRVGPLRRLAIRHGAELG
jgi:2-octaprenyl-6-methoxyphenol hydroxylase